MKSHILLLHISGVWAMALSAQAHELRVGRNESDQIIMHIEGGQPFDLEESPFPGFDGFAASDPGFVALPVDNPGEGIFALPSNADLEFELLGADAQIQVWNDTGTAPMLVGERFTMGQPLFHIHPIWHSPDGMPGEEYGIQIRLHDISGQLAASDAYTLLFTPVPEPTPAAGLLLLGAIAGRRRL